MSNSANNQITPVPKPRRMDCSCCGGEAGRFSQWHNRDTGFGVCRRCLEWMKGREEEKRGFHDFIEERRLYGEPGIHYEARHYVIYGHKVTLVADFPETDVGTKAANDFMTKLEGASVLAVSNSRIWIAMKGDLGEKVESMPEGLFVAKKD